MATSSVRTGTRPSANHAHGCSCSSTRSRHNLGHLPLVIPLAAWLSYGASSRETSPSSGSGIRSGFCSTRPWIRVRWSPIGLACGVQRPSGSPSTRAMLSARVSTLGATRLASLRSRSTATLMPCPTRWSPRKILGALWQSTWSIRTKTPTGWVLPGSRVTTSTFRSILGRFTTPQTSKSTSDGEPRWSTSRSPRTRSLGWRSPCPAATCSAS
mmetsp:Transcript_47756/g.113783  ORF Transcript_47756/g.113783 Transcript_47756/m.113783 type:complete len:213 (+) Transcript_47756:415-1053(+)